MALSVPMKVGIVLFIVCMILGISLQNTIIICTTHYIAHQIL